MISGLSVAGIDEFVANGAAKLTGAARPGRPDPQSGRETPLFAQGSPNASGELRRCFSL